MVERHAIPDTPRQLWKVLCAARSDVMCVQTILIARAINWPATHHCPTIGRMIGCCVDGPHRAMLSILECVCDVGVVGHTVFPATATRIKTLGTCRTVLYIQRWMEMYDVYLCPLPCHSCWHMCTPCPIVCCTYTGLHLDAPRTFELHTHSIYRVPHMCKIQFEAAPFFYLRVRVRVWVCVGCHVFLGSLIAFNPSMILVNVYQFVSNFFPSLYFHFVPPSIRAIRLSYSTEPLPPPLTAQLTVPTHTHTHTQARMAAYVEPHILHFIPVEYFASLSVSLDLLDW